MSKTNTEQWSNIYPPFQYNLKVTKYSWPSVSTDFPGGASGKEPTYQCRRVRHDWSDLACTYSVSTDSMNCRSKILKINSKSSEKQNLDFSHYIVALVVKNPPAHAGDIRDVGLIPGSGRSPGEGHGNPLKYSCLENPMDRGAWWATVHRVTQSQTRLRWLNTHRHHE